MAVTRPGRAAAVGRGSWLNDFAVRRGRLHVRDTGAELVIDRDLIGDGFVWLVYHLVVRSRSVWLAATGKRGPAVWFAPAPPRPWYVLWSAMAWAGIRIARSPQAADAAFAFKDQTLQNLGRPPLSPAFNFDCADISKTRVAEVFEAVFGYPLAIDR